MNFGDCVLWVWYNIGFVFLGDLVCFGFVWFVLGFDVPLVIMWGWRVAWIACF